MKILWFTNTPCGASKKLSQETASGGWLSSLEDSIKRNNEIELHIAFYYKKQIEDFYFENVYYHPILNTRFSSKLGSLINNYKEYLGFYKNHNQERIKEIITKIKPDLIHVHGTESEFGLFQKTINDIPTVISIQGIINSCYEKLFSGLDYQTISKNESLFQKLTLKNAQMSKKRFEHSSFTELEILKLSKYVIGRTEFDKHAILAMSPNIKYFIGNEILRKEFYNAKWEKKCFSENFTIVTTISSGYYKGLEVILRTARNLKRINFKFQWLIIGQTENSRDAKIISKCLNLNFTKNNVKMLGRKSAVEIVEILKSADLYCQTSHIENSPNSVCEAMLIGMPIIASYAGGTPSILEHNKEGYLIQDGDSFSLAGSIIDISKEFNKAKGWGDEAYKKANYRHNHDRIHKEYINIYKEILNLSKNTI